jgi:hypothetical protein
MGKQTPEDANTNVPRRLHVSNASEESFSFGCHTYQKKSRRKMTKVIHTFCFLRASSEGCLLPYYCQLTSDCGLRSPQALRRLALRQVEQHVGQIGAQVLQQVKRNDDVGMQARLEQGGEQLFERTGVLVVRQIHFHW